MTANGSETDNAFLHKRHWCNHHLTVFIDRFFQFGFVLNKQHTQGATNIVACGIAHLPTALSIQIDIDLWTAIFIKASAGIRNIFAGNNGFSFQARIGPLTRRGTKIKGLAAATLSFQTKLKIGGFTDNTFSFGSVLHTG